MTPDWSREKKDLLEWNPSKSLLLSIRDYQKFQLSRNPLAGLFKKLAVVRHAFWSVVTGAEIPLNSNIGGGLMIPHPNGIVIHPDVVIGPNCLIFQQVTIGTQNSEAVPTIGARVDIGAGAKILGDVVIGNHVKIGANSVVIEDLPDHAVAVGIPAKVIKVSAH